MCGPHLTVVSSGASIVSRFWQQPSHMRMCESRRMLGLSSTVSDWLWPESHASPAFVAAVLGIVHKVAQTCIQYHPFRLVLAKISVAYSWRYVWLRPKSRPNSSSDFYAMHHAVECFDVSALWATSSLVRTNHPSSYLSSCLNVSSAITSIIRFPFAEKSPLLQAISPFKLHNCPLVQQQP